MENNWWSEIKQIGHILEYLPQNDPVSLIPRPVIWLPSRLPVVKKKNERIDHQKKEKGIDFCAKNKKREKWRELIVRACENT